MQTALVRQNEWNRLQSMPRGEQGTLQTLRLMAAFCKRDAASIELRAVAQKIIEGIAGHDFASEIRALYSFARDQVKYRKDPVEVERVQDALRTIQFRSGDCDDKVVLLVTLLAVCGHRARLCVSGPVPGKWTHVYCEVATPQGWMPLDPTPEAAQPGWQTNAPAKGIFEIWPATSTNIRVVRVPVRSSSVAVRSGRTLGRQVRQPVATFSCLGCDCEESGLGADKYEWKMNSGGECELKKKSCGLFCKIGKGFKAVGKIALSVAPIALAPFTGGLSLAAGAAMSGGMIAANVAAAAAPSIVQMIAQRSGAPANAEVEEPTGACRAWLEKKQQEENDKARQAAEAAAAAAKANQDALIKSEAQKLAAKESSAGSSVSGLLSNPLMLGALGIGALLLLRK